MMDSSKVISKIEFTEQLKLFENVENTMRVRDYLINKYISDEAERFRHLNQQFRVNGGKGFYDSVRQKMELDRTDKPEDTDESDWQIMRLFDLPDLLRQGDRTYVHFNWSDELDSKMVSQLVTKLARRTDNKCVLLVTNSTGTKKMTIDGTKVIPFPFSEIFGNVKTFPKTFFPISTSTNNLFLINKMLVARNTLFELIETRKYTGQPDYTFYDDISGNFAHFGMDLETRYLNTCNDSLPLDQRNYFDVFNVYKDSKREQPVYFHFLTKNEDDIGRYIKRLVEDVRKLLDLSDTATVNLVLITAKKITAKSPFKELGDIDRQNRLTVDVIQLDTLLYNPLKNVYQPKFKLIKRGEPERDNILRHCGGADAIPKMLVRDPVNKFFGGEPGDIYEIKRTQHIRINEDTSSQIHLDVTYRMVKK